MSAFDRFGENRIGIKVIENEDVVHASVRDEGKTAGEISGDDTFQFVEGKDSGTDLVVPIHVVP